MVVVMTLVSPIIFTAFMEPSMDEVIAIRRCTDAVHTCIRPPIRDATFELPKLQTMKMR